MRAQIARHRPPSCCRRYILAALLEGARTLRSYPGPVLVFSSLELAQWAIKVLRSLEIEFLWTRSGRVASRYILKLIDLPKLSKVRRTLHYCLSHQATRTSGDQAEEREELHFSFGPHKNLTLKLCCRRHWLGALFLRFGALSDPQKGYLLEWALPRLYLAEKVKIALELEGFNPQMAQRRRRWVVSLKRAEEVAQALSVIGAQLARLQFEEVRALKETRNEVRRRVNAESANIARSSLAAARQIAKLRELQESGALDQLSPQLQNVARLRLENPEATLSELCQLCDPPLSRTTLNRRLQQCVIRNWEGGNNA